MDLSVIIVSYNVRNLLEQSVISVRKAAEKIDCEIFIVDNNSADGSCSMIRTEFPEIKLIMNHDNRGFSAANNQALHLAKGKYILLLNPDTLVQEDTFTKCISFMEGHPDAGSLGVRMINGRGLYLPESKRGLPTPETAFYKIIGLARLFPHSDRFNRYYLGSLDPLKIAKVDIISGAFMFLRRRAVEKTGLLDEEFFMYGEDVDYSYRLSKAGFSNYYYPDVTIIHYKGESTRKENLNVVVNFYRAMLIFARKHFRNGKSGKLIHLIEFAVFMRASLSFFRRIFKKIILPLTDSIIIFFSYLITPDLLRELRIGEGYSDPAVLSGIIITGYTLLTLLSIALNKGYNLPSRISDSIKGIIGSTLVILIIYALMPQILRFPKEAILAGSVMILALIPLSRILMSLIFFDGIVKSPFRKTMRTVVVSDNEGYLRIKDLIKRNKIKSTITGRVSISQTDMDKDVLGNIEQLTEIIRINRIGEIIFTTRELSASQIIESMHKLSGTNVSIRIAGAGERSIAGSKYSFPGKYF